MGADRPANSTGWRISYSKIASGIATRAKRRIRIGGTGSLRNPRGDLLTGPVCELALTSLPSTVPREVKPQLPPLTGARHRRSFDGSPATA